MMFAAEIGETWPRPASSVMNMAALQAQERTTDKKMSFLDLPYELRLHIYHLVHQVSPVQCKQLIPWDSFSICTLHVVQKVTVAVKVAEDDTEESWEARVDGRARAQPRLLSAQRPYAHMPTSVLLACRQTFAEARCIPFWQNEFAFINWFSSGLSSALAFTRGRQPWQRTAMRFVRLEMFVRDLVEERLAEWIELCGLWPGVRGLRLTVSTDRGEAYRKLGAVKATACCDAWALVAARDSATTRWATEGLGQLGELRQLEIELADSTWSSSDKVAWCRQLERIVQSPDGGEVDVVCVERKCNNSSTAS